MTGSEGPTSITSAFTLNPRCATLWAIAQAWVGAVVGNRQVLLSVAARGKSGTFSQEVAKLARERPQQAALNQSGDEESQQLAHEAGGHGHVVRLQRWQPV